MNNTASSYVKSTKSFCDYHRLNAARNSNSSFPASSSSRLSSSSSPLSSKSLTSLPTKDNRRHFVGAAEVALMLISKGADVNAKNNEGSTPLELACLSKSSDVVNVLLNVNVNVTKPLSESALKDKRQIQFLYDREAKNVIPSERQSLQTFPPILTCYTASNNTSSSCSMNNSVDNGSITAFYETENKESTQKKKDKKKSRVSIFIVKLVHINSTFDYRKILS